MEEKNKHRGERSVWKFWFYKGHTNSW